MDVRLAGFTQVNLSLEIFILTIFYLLMDLWLLILPLHTIWSLQLPLRTRIGVAWVFIFGGVACAGAILKTVDIYPVFHSYDPLCKPSVSFVTPNRLLCIYSFVFFCFGAPNRRTDISRPLPVCLY